MTVPGRTSFAFRRAGGYGGRGKWGHVMTDGNETRVLARLNPSAPRRVVGTAMLAAIGVLLIWVVVRHPPPQMIGLAFLLVVGVGTLWMAARLWLATAQGLELTDTELRESHSHRALARMADIVSVDRGAFAVKPTAGFALHMRQPGRMAWAPGLWWQVGRRIGVGGVTHRHEARLMAEILAERLKARDRVDD